MVSKMISRRSVLWGLVAAPAIVRAGSLMPVKALTGSPFVFDEGNVTAWVPIEWVQGRIIIVGPTLSTGVDNMLRVVQSRVRAEMVREYELVLDTAVNSLT